MNRYNTIFAYNSVNDLSTATITTYTIAWANDTSISNAIFHELMGGARQRDVLSTTLKLSFKLGKLILIDPTARAFFVNFFQANFRWAAYKTFMDASNSGYSNLCKCNVDSNDDGTIEIDMARDAQGYELFSDNVF